MSGDFALGAQGFGAGQSALGAYFNASGQKTTLNAQANLDDTNAKLQEMTAQSALLSGQRQEQASDIKYANIKSAQKTAFAANGIDLNSTTPLNVLTGTDAVKEVDAATIAANAGRAAFGARETGLSYSNKARGERAQADSISPFMSATGSIISSAGTVASSWYQLKKNGAFDTPDKKDGTTPTPDWLTRQIGDNLVSRTLY